MSKNSNKKFRNWSFILYSESAPENWRQWLIKQGIPTACSPWHDSDKDTEGNLLKAHKHVVVAFSGPTTFNNVKSLITDPLNATRPEPVASIRGYYQYFTHELETNKAIYSSDDIECLNGFNIDRFGTGDKVSSGVLTSELCELIFNSNVDNFFELFQMAKNLGIEYVDVVSKKAYFFRCVLNDIKRGDYDAR